MPLEQGIIKVVVACGTIGMIVAGCAEPQPAATAPSPSPGPPVASAAPGGVQVDQVPPGQELASFRRALAMRGLPTGTDDEQTTLYATTICGELDRGAPPQEVVLNVQAGTGYSLEDTGYLIGAGLASFCPHNVPKVQQR